MKIYQYLTHPITKQYFDFKTRSDGEQFWFYMLQKAILLGAYVFTIRTISGAIDTDIVGDVGAVIFVLFCLYTVIPVLALSVRRLHDSGNSAWLLLFTVVPMVGVIIYIIFMFIPSNKGDNKYGPPSKPYGSEDSVLSHDKSESINNNEQ